MRYINPFNSWYKLKNLLINGDKPKELVVGDQILLKNG